MSAYAAETKEAARVAYITSRRSIKETASLFNVADSVVERWRLEAKKNSDDWDLLREQFFVVGGGMEEIVRQTLAEHILQHKQALEDLKVDETVSATTKIEALAKLSQSLSKTVESSRLLLPKTDRLATALEIVKELAQFVRQRQPQCAAGLLEILEPFGKKLFEEYSR